MGVDRDPDTCEIMFIPTLDPTFSPSLDPTIALPTVSVSTTMSPLNDSNTTGIPFREAEPGWTDTQLALVIVLPTIAVLCIILILAMVFKMKSDNDKLGGGSYTR